MQNNDYISCAISPGNLISDPGMLAARAELRQHGFNTKKPILYSKDAGFTTDEIVFRQLIGDSFYAGKG